MTRMWLKTLYLLVVLLIAGCSGEPETGPVEVKWDRDICERCRMVLSDPHFAAQIRYYPDAKKRSKVAKFDDIGCAVLWLKDKAWKDDVRTEFWVADHRTKEWIDARAANYVKKNTTPMEYGLGAQPEMEEGSLNFAQAKEHIEDVEKRFNVHGLQLQQRLQEQAQQREQLK
ncbi:MAG: nitrous oxide reductase accessory protein NosL [Gammaproteobacteria bacterium]|nr:nitrous oxide reductase accessory protein NosL [Gammaproteobacteria bacterium]